MKRFFDSFIRMLKSSKLYSREAEARRKRIQRLCIKCKKDKINAYAAQSAFFIILSAIPFLMVFSSLLQYTPITKDALLGLVRELMPEYVAPLLAFIVEEVYSNSGGLISVTAVAALWSAAKGMQYITDGLNAVHELEETRNWLMMRVWAVLYTLVFLLAILFTLIVLVFGNSLANMIVPDILVFEVVRSLFSSLRGVFMPIFLILLFDVMFAALPNRRLTLKSQLPGAILCGVSWYVVAFGLSVYVDYFNGFSMYGSLTTVTLVMLWIYFCMYIMLISAEINIMFCK
ncbi:MAG: YihY/virulence factor BrkB family protein [Clostridiales bacterium]|nr:YihY/virulence factor BrkB family protein [Clostridiales bacterium]